MTTAALDQLLDRARDLDGRPLPGVRMTERQFVAWAHDEDLNAEWVDGEVIVMPPVSGEHSDLNLWLMRLVADFVEERELGVVRGPEFQIRLSTLRRRRNPDVFFLARSKVSRLRPNHLEGPPDLISEIVSPDSESRDWREKYLEYERAGVREYWIVDPSSERVEAYALGRTKAYRRLPEADGKIESKVLRGLFIRPAWLWRSPRSKLSTIRRGLGLPG